MNCGSSSVLRSKSTITLATLENTEYTLRHRMTTEGLADRSVETSDAVAGPCRLNGGIAPTVITSLLRRINSVRRSRYIFVGASEFVV